MYPIRIDSPAGSPDANPVLGLDKIASDTAETLAPIQMALGPGAHYDLPPFGCTAQLRLTYAWGTLIYGWYDDGGASLASWIGNAPDFALSLQPGKVPRILNTSASGYTFLIQYTRSLP